jgi:glycosyltransferase involved in cell wall biosynthesis
LTPPTPRVLIVADHASLKFGGEAALPLHYFRVLLSQGLHVHLLVHERTRPELLTRFPDHQHLITYISDTPLHRWMWQLGKNLPDRVASFSTGLVSRIATQLSQRTLARALVASQGITVVHQPIPVSPKEPSLLRQLGAPVVIGPMNGGMDFPPGFRHMQGRGVTVFMALGRWFSNLVNRWFAGKHEAALLLVANERTRLALPKGLKVPVVELVENGVDLSLWRPTRPTRNTPADGVTRFVFVGRLVDWKAVNLLLDAFAQARTHAPIALTIIGDGDEMQRLQAQAARLGLSHQEGPAGQVTFTGWLSQAACAEALASSHALVLPSLNECGGAVVLEAMSMALPVIASRWGGPADYLNQACGILVDPIDETSFVKGLADAMVTMARDETTRAHMGRAGRARVESEFDWAIKGQRIVQLYQQAMTHDSRR